MDARSHWDKVYATKRPEILSWYCPHLDISLALIEHSASERSVHIIDVGGGASTLVDDLLLRGYQNVTVLDISEGALDIARRRLGDDAGRVHWIVGDVMKTPLKRDTYDVWHDRAVFHFLTKPEERAAYLRQLAHALKPGGHVIIGTFGPAGPTTCSGLDVMRYDEKLLQEEFGKQFRLVEGSRQLHHTPEGVTQEYMYCLFRQE
jgi:SAM-dependent methyltransferase